jgi:SAM-dependent methyltransferase
MPAQRELYDRIGVGYAGKRRPDRRWASHIERALGDATSVLNVGAGAGSYEPSDRAVVALEPSREMLSQRPIGASPVVRGVAGALPFRDSTFEAAMAILTVHHWPDIAGGIAEMRRVASRQVIVSWDVDAFAERFWFTRDYLRSAGPEEHRLADAAILASQLEQAVLRPLPVPHDCTDGFFAAYWRRPEAYLDPAVRASISGLALLDADVLDPALARLESDLRTGKWERRYAHLLTLDEIDVGYRLVIGGHAAARNVE